MIDLATWRGVLGVAAAVAVLADASASAATSDWVSGSKARVRLVAAGVDGDGRLSAGIEIRLPPGWDTYWRFPGDSGIAPTIDFSTSRNVGVVDVRFPVPQRMDDGFLITNVYTGRVVLPVSAEVLDKGSAIDLALSLDLGVCQAVCIPDHVEVRLLVPADKTDPAAAKVLADARSALPGPAEPGVFAVDGNAVRDGGTDKRPAFRFSLTAPDVKDAVVFVEGPDDWFAAAPELVDASGDRATYTVKFDRLVAKTPIAGATIHVTAVSGGRAIEQTVGLD